VRLNVLSAIGVIEATVPFACADTVVTATATSPEGDTSEFSPCAVVDAGEDAGVLQFSQMKFLGYEEQGFVTVLVSRSGGNTGTVTVHYATADDSATSPADYMATSGTLTFGDGEFPKSFDVPLVLDGEEGGNETIELVLTDPTGGATLGTLGTSEILLFDCQREPNNPQSWESNFPHPPNHGGKRWGLKTSTRNGA